jgi:hypothetical protein
VSRRVFAAVLLVLLAACGQAAAPEETMGADCRSRDHAAEPVISTAPPENTTTTAAAVRSWTG